MSQDRWDQPYQFAGELPPAYEETQALRAVPAQRQLRAWHDTFLVRAALAGACLACLVLSLGIIVVVVRVVVAIVWQK